MALRSFSTFKFKSFVTTEDLAMGEEINEGVKLKPRVMAGNNLVARSELFPLPHPLVLFVGPLLDESGGLEMGWRREGRSTRATSPRVPPQLLNRPAQLLPPKKSNRRDKCADMSGGLISTSLSPALSLFILLVLYGGWQTKSPTTSSSTLALCGFTPAEI